MGKERVGIVKWVYYVSLISFGNEGGLIIGLKYIINVV